MCPPSPRARHRDEGGPDVHAVVAGRGSAHQVATHEDFALQVATPDITTDGAVPDRACGSGRRWSATPRVYARFDPEEQR